MKFVPSKVAGRALVLSAITAPLFARASTVSDMVATISFADVLTAVVTIGLLVIAVDMALIGYLKVRHLVKGAR